MIREGTAADFESIRAVVNDAAIAYKNTIPAGLYREPWMSEDYLRQELARGVTFFVYQRDGVMLGVMGVQDVDDVTLIRHSYVCTAERRAGIGSELIRFHKARASRPVLVGCLKAMPWAINFYQLHGFVLVSDTVRDELRKRYWNLSAEHVRNSVVLVDEAWLKQNKRAE